MDQSRAPWPISEGIKVWKIFHSHPKNNFFLFLLKTLKQISYNFIKK